MWYATTTILIPSFFWKLCLVYGPSRTGWPIYFPDTAVSIMYLQEKVQELLNPDRNASLITK